MSDQVLKPTVIVTMAVLVGSAASCTPCPDGTSRQLVAHQSGPNVQYRSEGSGNVKCFDGSRWRDFEFSNGSIRFSVAGMPKDAPTQFFKPTNLLRNEYALFVADCAPPDQVKVFAVALEPLNQYQNAAEVLWTSYGFSALDNRTKGIPKRPYGLCVSGGVAVELDLYVPKYECVAKPPSTVTRSGGGRRDICPAPPPPSVTPPPSATTCSGRSATAAAQAFEFLVRQPNGCGNTFTTYANSLEEAKGCATTFGVQAVPSLCEFEVRIQIEPAIFVYKVAANAADASACAQNSEGSVGPPVVTKMGSCI